MNSLQASRKLLMGLWIVGQCVFVPLPVVGQPPSRTDHLGDPLPEGAIFRLGTARLRHPGAFRRLLFTDDGKVLIAVGFQQMPSAWDVETGRRIKTDATELELLDKATSGLRSEEELESCSS